MQPMIHHPRVFGVKKTLYPTQATCQELTIDNFSAHHPRSVVLVVLVCTSYIRNCSAPPEPVFQRANVRRRSVLQGTIVPAIHSIGGVGLHLLHDSSAPPEPVFHRANVRRSGVCLREQTAKLSGCAQTPSEKIHRTFVICLTSLSSSSANLALEKGAEC